MCSRILGQGGPIAARNRDVESETGKSSLDAREAKLWFSRLSGILRDSRGVVSFPSIDLRHLSCSATQS